jgi:hypothetical protein
VYGICRDRWVRAFSLPSSSCSDVRLCPNFAHPRSLGVGSKTVWGNAILRLVSKFKTRSRFTSSLKQGDESQDSSTAPHETIAAEKETLRKIFQETVDSLSPNRLSQHLDELDKHLASLLTTSEWRLKLRNQWIARVKELSPAVGNSQESC